MARALKQGECTRYWFDAMGLTPVTELPVTYGRETRELVARRIAAIQTDPSIAVLESAEFKRKWEPLNWDEDLRVSSLSWLSETVEQALIARGRPATVAHMKAAVQAEERFLAVGRVFQGANHVDMDRLLDDIVAMEGVPNHSSHVYTDDGLVVRDAWEQIWELQRRVDRGENLGPIVPPPEYSQGSRGKPTHFLRTEYWKLRGKLDMPKERFIAFTEVPGRDGEDTLYGWAGWTPIERIRVMLAIDEDLEDDAVPLADRVGLLDSAWRLLDDAEREDAATASRLRAELRSIIGGDGVSAEQLADWKVRFPPPKAGRRR